LLLLSTKDLAEMLATTITRPGEVRLAFEAR
jgi:hypothetical protein